MLQAEAASPGEKLLTAPRPLTRSSSPILDRYRHHCSAGIPDIEAARGLNGPDGFFRFGEGVVCYGRTTGKTRLTPGANLFDASQEIPRRNGSIFLPFEADQVFDNLRFERYVHPSGRWLEKSWAKDIYYRLRPMFPVSFRKHLQKIYLRGWSDITFPQWPLDRSVDILFERLLVLVMQESQTHKLPFIWFWPDGYRTCVNMTHDVETKTGRDFCDALMDIDDSFGINSSFQVVPERRYGVSQTYLGSIRSRGRELNVHGLDHEGNLFETREAFLALAQKINQYAVTFGARGFRSPSMYRNVDWLQELDFSYDMSVPNVARLEPQRGGCCTVMPYFLPGGMVELPLTTTQDYSLFHILKDYSTSLWKKQIDLILEGNGLISFIVHPDYVIESHAQDAYKELLQEIDRLRSERGAWVTVPGEVDRWWRERGEMKLSSSGNGWKIEGTGSERARVAHACLDGGQLVYEIDPEGGE